MEYSFSLINPHLCKRILNQSKNLEYMENGTIPTLDMEYFKQFSDNMDYVDDDFMVATDITVMSKEFKTVRMNIFMLAGCVEGRVQLETNGKSYQLQSNEAIVVLPTTIVSSIMISPYNKMRIIGFSTQFLHQIIKQETDTERIFGYLYQHPVQHTEDRPDYIKYYTDLLMAKIKQPAHRYKKVTLKHIFSALFCEMMAGLFKKNG